MFLFNLLSEAAPTTIDKTLSTLPYMLGDSHLKAILFDVLVPLTPGYAIPVLNIFVPSLTLTDVEHFIPPTTCNFSVGASVPIPTSPLFAFINNLVVVYPLHDRKWGLLPLLS